MSFFAEKSTFFDENRRFSRLVKCYANRLRDPHAEGDLWSFLWNVKKITNGAKSDRYYAVCLRNKYVDLFKLENKTKCENIEDYALKSNDPLTDEKIDLQSAFGKLSDKQNAVIKLHFIYGYSIAEIAIGLGISRQAVNKIKMRGLYVLREILSA